MVGAWWIDEEAGVKNRLSREEEEEEGWMQMYERIKKGEEKKEKKGEGDEKGEVGKKEGSEEKRRDCWLCGSREYEAKECDTCWKCLRRGHKAYDCVEEEKECELCGGVHWTIECGEVEKGGMVKDLFGEEEETRGGCSKCRSIEHKVRDCPERRGGDE